MKSLAKFSLTIILTLFVCNTSFAQKQQRSPYDVLVVTAEKQRLHGTIAAINATELVLVDRKDIAQHIEYAKINRIKVFKKHADVGYAIVTSALAAGAIVAGQSANDGNVATLIGVGGTISVVALSMVLHNVIHGAEVTLKADKEKIDYQSVNTKLSKYLVKDLSIKP